MANKRNGLFRNGKTYFTQVSNHAIRDAELSLQAKGLYALIQSYITIENFTLYKTMLVKQCGNGGRSFNSAWKELKESGYLVQHKLKDSVNGSFYYEYELLDIKNPPTPFACVANAGVHNVPVYNTVLSNTYLNNTKSLTSLDKDEQFFLKIFYEYFGYHHRRVVNSTDIDSEYDYLEDEEKFDTIIKFFKQISNGDKLHDMEQCSMDNFFASFKSYVR